jgi:glutamine amidotransferase
VITIIDYGSANIRSVERMLHYIGQPCRLAADGAQLAGSTKIILPGVGKFDFGMSQLRHRGFEIALEELVIHKRTPILGICLGLQMLTRGSEEGALPGLGWIAADTISFDRKQLQRNERVPHMGWADTSFRADSRLFRGVIEIPRYYYVHSYHVRSDSQDDELCTAVHGYRFTSGLEKQHLLGVQFHPEKSHRFGMSILRNFASLY